MGYTMSDVIYSSVTNGRSLFNCSPVQYEQFSDSSKNVPRAGLLEEACTKFGYTLGVSGGLWFVRDEDETAVVGGIRARRSALVLWWARVGQGLVTRHRDQHREWEGMRKPGRQAGKAEGETGYQRTQQRSAARALAWTKVENVWAEASKCLVEHSPMTESWLAMATSREVPRQHSVRRVTAVRAIVEAVRHLYDVENLNPTIRGLLNGGEADDEQISGALMQELPELSARGEVAGTMPRIALMVALQLSPHPASQVFEDLHAILERYQIHNVDELKLHCELVGGQ